MKKQLGFTMIELVIVIVILGIVAAVAVPRFVGIAGDARVATVNALTGSLRSAAMLAKATSLSQSKTEAASISMEGVTVTMSNFYPTADTAGIGAAMLEVRGFTQASGVFTKDGAADGGSNCRVTYVAAAANAAPGITPLTSGC